jgi:hypothetical protein
MIYAFVAPESLVAKSLNDSPCECITMSGTDFDGLPAFIKKTRGKGFHIEFGFFHEPLLRRSFPEAKRVTST